MTERMTDERLAEIERRITKSRITLIETWELLQALKAERAEVARLKKEYDVNINNLLDRIDELSGCDWSATKRQAKAPQ